MGRGAWFDDVDLLVLPGVVVPRALCAHDRREVRAQLGLVVLVALREARRQVRDLRPREARVSVTGRP